MAEQNIYHDLCPPITPIPSFKWSKFLFAIHYIVLVQTEKYKASYHISRAMHTFVRYFVTFMILFSRNWAIVFLNKLSSK